MAAPHVAASAALVLKAQGKGVSKNMRTLLQTTSRSIPQTLAANSPPQTLAQQGAGMINVFNAITYKTAVSPGELLFNDTAENILRNQIIVDIESGEPC